MNVRMKRVFVYIVVVFGILAFRFSPFPTTEGEFAPLEQPDQFPFAVPSPTAQPTPIAVIPNDHRGHLVSEDGWIPLRDSACNEQTIRFHLASGATVRVRETVWACNSHWYRVELPGSLQQGWVPITQVVYDGP